MPHFGAHRDSGEKHEKAEADGEEATVLHQSLESIL
jgi:hypothetical protein